MLRVTVEDLGSNVILHCAGRIVHGHETAILCAAARHAGRDITLNLTEVETIDAAGTGALIALQAAGIYLRLLNPSKPVREILRLTRIESVFEILAAGDGESDMVRKGGFPNALSLQVAMTPAVSGCR